MTRSIILMCAVALAATSVACKGKSEQQAAPTSSVQIPVKEDYEQEVGQSITEDNLEDALSTLEKEMAADTTK